MSEPEARRTSVVLAGGGSAGHTSPLIATADELRRQAPDVRLTAIGTERGLETTVIPAAGLPLELIPPVPMPRRPGLDLLKVPARLARAVSAAADVLRRVDASVLVGFGGYVSTPAYLAARRLGVPIVIHEGNIVPGLANKLAARFTTHVYTSFPATPLPHAECIGLPLRRAITELDRAGSRDEARKEFDLAVDQPTLLVSGGSQGAASINRAVQESAGDLLRAGIQVLHVLGPKNLTADTVHRVDPDTGAVYAPLAFVERMELAYAAADLMLGRCGANTVMETSAVGLPAVYVPYPVGNGEQRRNAAGVVEAGGGELLEDADCTPEWARAKIPELILDPERLARMSAASRDVGRTDAAAELARRTLEVAQSWA
jgi:UDP-N-acetylglucosamine--N-acetylmuramyl-(pentapeptide) pyrophosphoryl-undecaprenol N-acetylglucosamine transferase